MTSTIAEPYVDARTAAEVLGKDRRWLYAVQQDLHIPRYRVGSHYRYRISELIAWVEASNEPVQVQDPA